MTPIGFHVRMSLEGRRVLAATPAALRSAARIFLEHGADAEQIAFRLADTHLHALLLCGRAVAGAFVHRVECALRWALRSGAPFEAPHLEPVFTQRHLARAFWYVLQQEARHGTALDPMHEGSSLYDTLGLRVVDPLLPVRVMRALPRTSRPQLAALLGPGAHELIEHDGGGPLRIERLPDSAAAALGLPELSPSRSPSYAQARTSAVVVALANAHRWDCGRANGHTRALARVLDWSWWSVNRASRAEPTSPALNRAVLRQWQLRSGLADGHLRETSSLEAEAPSQPPGSW